MARMSVEAGVLYGALSIVKRDAQEKVEWHKKRLTEKPFIGQTQEDHNEYHLKHMEEAKTVVDYCFVRQMQIDPD